MLDNSKRYLYHKLSDIIISEINDKKLKPDDRILPEREYSEKYNLSRSTVRQAISYLEKKGYLYKVQGSGTFVSSRIFKQKLLKFYSFTDEMKKQGRIPKSEIISFKKILANESVAKELEIELEEEIYELIRLRLADDEPMMYEITYLPCSKMKKLTKANLIEKPLYEVMQNKYGIKFTKAIEKFSVLSLDKKISKILNSKNESASIKLERKTYSNFDLVEYTISYLKGDKFEFEIELNQI